MAIDTSLYGQIQPPQNPLMMAGEAVGISNALQQNRLLQTENQRQQVALDSDQIANAWTHLSKAGEAATTLLNEPGKLSLDSFDKGATGILSDRDYPTAMRSGLISDIVGIRSNLQKQIAAQNPQGDPVATDRIIRQNLQNIATLTENGRAQLQSIYGAPQAVDTGPVTKLVRTGVGGRMQDLGGIVNGLSPASAAQPVQTMKNGVAGTVPLGSLAPQGEAAPGTLIPPGGQTAATAAAPAQAPQPHFNPTGLPVGEQGAIEHSATASADQYSGLRADVGQSAARIFSLRQALHGLETAGATGPGTDVVNNAKSFLVANAPGVAKFVGIDPEKIKSYDEAAKYLTQYASGAAGSFGPHTDQQLATALSGNASTHISNLAAKDVVKANIALERMKQAQVLAFEKSGQSPSQFADWSARWNTQNDPRAFLVDQMTGDERKKLQAQLKPGSADYSRFLNSYREARDLGIISPNDLPK